MTANDPREHARRAARDAPSDALAWIVLAEAELDTGDAHAGEQAARRALTLAPGHPEALARLGRAQSMLGRRDDAVASLQAALRAAPRHPGIAVWLGHALEDAGQAEAASDAYARAHALAPHEPQIAAYLLAWRRKLCDWRDLDALSAQVRDSVRRGQASIEPFAFLSEDSTPAEQLQCARLRARMLAAVQALPDRANDKSRQAAAVAGAASPIATLRVGFLSNGFGAHPTGLLTVALFEALAKRTDIAVHLFALNADDGSAIGQRLRAAAHSLHDVAQQPHRAIAQRIRVAGIDVLFDLRGWGGGGTPEVLAMRPAPL
ncbi:MAG: tetratricopeptide repeat protein, partial [Luteimonas sp.]